MFAVIVLSAVASYEPVLEWTLYDRPRVADGAWWLILTAQFAHLNLNHLLLDLVAWILIWFYGWHVCNNAKWLWLVASTTVLCGFAIHWFEPEVAWHGGLSGVLHGMFLAVSLLKINAYARDPVAWLGFAALAAKLVWEWQYGAIGNTQDLIGLPVLTEAHAYGTLAGLIACLILLLRMRATAATQA